MLRRILAIKIDSRKNRPQACVKVFRAWPKIKALVAVGNVCRLIHPDARHVVRISIVIDTAATFAKQIKPKVLNAAIGVHASVISTSQ